MYILSRVFAYPLSISRGSFNKRHMRATRRSPFFANFSNTVGFLKARCVSQYRAMAMRRSLKKGSQVYAFDIAIT